MKIKENKVLIVLPKLTCGGTERAASELANYIAEKGGNVTILLMYREEIFYSLHSKVKLIQPNDVKRRIGRVLYIPYLMNFLRRNIKSEKPEVIFCLGYIAYTLGASIGLNASVIISGRSSPTRVRFPGNKLLTRAYTWSHWALRKRVDGIIAQTQFAAEVYSKKYKIPIRVIPNFLRDLKVYDLPRINQIITVGRCSFEKGQHYLIEAFSKLQAPGWKLVIVGDGPKSTELKNQTKHLGIEANVIFAGFQQDVDFFLSQSKIFVFTSIIEGFPNALMEALATPLACVSFDCEAGPSDLINDGENGFLVRVGDVDGLVDKIQLLINNENLRNSITEKAAHAKREYELGEVANEYLNFFTEIRNRQRGLNYENR
jgi:glycosyltransferase involved in cell wall biosynthesis